MKDLSHLDFTHDTQISIPLPNQVPVQPILQGLPSEILKSKTISHLLLHSEDLAARLKVTLKQLEQNEDLLSEKNRALEETLFQFEKLKDQLFILKEKSLYLSSQREKEDQEKLELKKELDLIQIQYSQLYTHQEQIQSENSKALLKLQRRIKRLDNFKKQLKWAYKRLKEEFSLTQNTLVSSTLQWEQEQNELKTKLSEFEKQLHLEQESVLKNKEERANELLFFKQEVHLLKEETLKLQMKNSELSELFESNILLKNENIELERRRSEEKAFLEEQLFQLQTQLNETLRVKDSITQSHTLLEQTSLHFKEKFESLDLNYKNKEEENQKLENLLIETQKQLDQMQNQNQSLKKLNKSLSLQLNEARHSFRESQSFNQMSLPPETNTNYSQNSILSSEKKLENLLEDFNRSIHGTPLNLKENLPSL